MNPLIRLIAISVVFMPFNVIADDFMIKLHRSPAPNEILIEVTFKFDKTSVLYHWQSAKSLYPILNRGLFIKCQELETQQDISFLPYEKVLPKLPHELDVLEVTEYKEILKIIPGQNYKIDPLKKGIYTMKMIYNSKELREYPGGKKLTPMDIESNEISFEIN